MKAFVTGGAGFVGSNLVRGLNERGIKARVLVRPASAETALAGLSYEKSEGDVLDDAGDLAQAMGGVRLSLPRGGCVRLLATRTVHNLSRQC